MGTEKKEKLNEPHCILGSEVYAYESELCRALTQIRKPGDERTPSKLAIISSSKYTRKFMADTLKREITTLVKRIDLSNHDYSAEELEEMFVEKVVYICEECQYLFQRRPGGFEKLVFFLNQVINNEREIITTWNLYSWNFLRGFLDIGHWFTMEIHLPFLQVDKMHQYLVSTLANPPSFIIDIELENKVEWVKKEFDFSLSMANISFKIPYFTLERRYSSQIPFTRSGIYTPEEIILREIYRLSMGDPSIAQMILNQTMKDDQVRFSNLPKLAEIPSLSVHDAFILSLILMYEEPPYHLLNKVIEDEAQLISALYRLVTSGIIIRNGNKIMIEPEGYTPAVKYLMQRRMIW